ncbi:hypothetical protein ACYOEI_30920 [Singulisphaera rosea]
MKVYLLLTDDGRRLFYAETPEESPDEEPTHHRGLRGWVERKARHLRSAWHHSESGVTARLRHVWSWLQERTYADESLLVRLRSAPTVEIHHPAGLSRDEVRELWKNYLASRKRRHLPWLCVNAFIAPLTVVLAPLPGPNLVGYWFGYRAIRHLLAFLGLRHAQRGVGVGLTFHPARVLDQPIVEGSADRDVVVAMEADPEVLDDFLKRSGVVRPQHVESKSGP